MTTARTVRRHAPHIRRALALMQLGHSLAAAARIADCSTSGLWVASQAAGIKSPLKPGYNATSHANMHVGRPFKPRPMRRKVYVDAE